VILLLLTEAVPIQKVRRPAVLTVIILVFISFLLANTELNFLVWHEGFLSHTVKFIIHL